MKKNKVIEQMIRIEHGDKVIRVWRDITNFQHSNEDIFRTIDSCESFTTTRIAEAIGDLPNVAAVEVLSNGNGIVLYPDWI